MAKPKPANTTSKKPKARRDWRARFLKDLATNGVVLTACRAAKIDRTTAYGLRRRDEAFAAEWDEAVEASVDLAEAELYRRAVKGCEKPVYQGGVEVGRIREYSDTLLIFLLKSNKPAKYREPKGDTIVNVQAPVASIPAAKAALDVLDSFDES